MRRDSESKRRTGEESEKQTNINRENKKQHNIYNMTNETRTKWRMEISDSVCIKKVKQVE